MFKSTNTVASGSSKTLLLGIHGSGKTTQAVHLQKAYGKGFIISGEGGLRSLQKFDIPYVPFSSWDGPHDGVNTFSFKGIVNFISSPAFKSGGYKWIMLDSLTELTERLHEHLSANTELWAKNPLKPNPLELWGKYGEVGLAALKWLRDLPMHVVVTSLVKDEMDDNNNLTYWPMVKGSAIAKQLPGIFDFVFALVKSTEGPRENPIIARHIITDEVHGWKCKSRDSRRRLKPVEHTSNMVDLIQRVDMSDADFSAYEKLLPPLTTEPKAKVSLTHKGENI